MFRDFSNVDYEENISSKPLTDIIIRQDGKQTIKFFIVKDFIRIHNQKTPVSNAVEATLLNLTDEGVKDNSFYKQEYHLKNTIKIGIVTAIIPDVFRLRFRKWNQEGALTRWLFCSYEYTEETKRRIKDSIDDETPKKIDPKITKCKYRGQRKVTISKEIAFYIRNLSEEVENRLKQYYTVYRHGNKNIRIYLEMEGFRLLKMIRLLAKSIAYDKERDYVNTDDLIILREICDYIRLPNDPKRV